MAEIDKESIANMLGSILGEDKKNTVNSLLDSLGGSETQNSPQNNSELLDSAEIMAKMTKVLGKLNNTKNNRDFALLYAIRPFMRAGRQGKIDTCLKMLQAVTVINEIKKEG